MKLIVRWRHRGIDLLIFEKTIFQYRQRCNIGLRNLPLSWHLGILGRSKELQTWTHCKAMGSLLIGLASAKDRYGTHKTVCDICICRPFLSCGLQVVTSDAHRSSLRRSMCPAQDHCWLCLRLFFSFCWSFCPCTLIIHTYFSWNICIAPLSG